MRAYPKYRGIETPVRRIVGDEPKDQRPRRLCLEDLEQRVRNHEASHAATAFISSLPPSHGTGRLTSDLAARLEPVP